ncbi:MAG: hypothetical protein WCJ62_07215, partial [Flavobacterium sp.]
MSKKLFIICFILISVISKAQYYSQHYLAPCPWQYYSNANELVISTNSTTSVTVTVSKSNGTLVTTLTTIKGAPAVYRFVGSPGSLNNYSFNTIISDGGLIISANSLVAVNYRNVASDAGGSNTELPYIKGNASLSSYGDAGIGTQYRLGYYRATTSGITNQCYSVMAIYDGTIVKLNGTVLTTLNAGQCYLFQTSIGSLLETSNGTVVNSGAAQDAPVACGDGVVDQVPPINVLGNDYFVVRGNGNNTAEQTVIVATQANTSVIISNFLLSGALSSSTTINLTNAGDYYAFVNGDSSNPYSANRVVSTKPVVVYSGTADGCEVDMSVLAPVGSCSGSLFVETSKFKGYTGNNLPYFGYVFLQSASAVVTINGSNLETLGGVRRQMGTTGWYLIDFTNTQISNPNILSIQSTVPITVSMVEQGGGFCMAAFFTNFTSLPTAPNITFNSSGLCSNASANLVAPTGYSSYQWYFNGVAISGASTNTYMATSSGNYSYASMMPCGLVAQSAPMNITIKKKDWNGSVSTDWNNVNNWSPAILPSSTDIVTIPSNSYNNYPIISGDSYTGWACNVTVKNGATLTVKSNNTITVTNWVNVETGGNFIVENNGSLVQINDVANTGNITYKRDSKVRSFDYVYYSSPVVNFNINNLSTTITTGPKYVWNPTISNSNNGLGNWVNLSSSIMNIGQGYIVRGPSSFGNTTASTFTSTFIGVPNNGTITVPVSRGSYTGLPYNGTNGTEINNLSDNFNLVGNPYPSSIRASQFLLNNNNVILGNVSLWTHQMLPSNLVTNPFYQSFGYNYTPNDYYTFNFTGTSCCPAASSDLFIGAGQGFFIRMADGPAASSNITFNNGLRNNSYTNSTFFKTNSNYSNNSAIDVNNIERHRFWLDIVDTALQVNNRTLIGYIDGASMDVDNFFDSETTAMTPIGNYSLVNERKFNIQGRALPFDNYDLV